MEPVKISALKAPGFSSHMEYTLAALPVTSGEYLANSLSALGIRFIAGGDSQGATLLQTPVHLLVSLASSSEARLRLALIPLFLEYPEFSGIVRSAAQIAHPNARLTLVCYYTSAQFFQQKYHLQIEIVIGKKAQLPDLFTQELGLSTWETPDDNLKKLAERHKILSGANVNWLGTYQHALRIWLFSLERKKHDQSG